LASVDVDVVLVVEVREIVVVIKEKRKKEGQRRFEERALSSFLFGGGGTESRAKRNLRESRRLTASIRKALY